MGGKEPENYSGEKKVMRKRGCQGCSEKLQETQLLSAEGVGNRAWSNLEEDREFWKHFSWGFKKKSLRAVGAHCQAAGGRAHMSHMSRRSLAPLALAGSIS